MVDLQQAVYIQKIKMIEYTLCKNKQNMIELQTKCANNEVDKTNRILYSSVQHYNILFQKYMVSDQNLLHIMEITKDCIRPSKMKKVFLF